MYIYLPHKHKGNSFPKPWGHSSAPDPAVCGSRFGSPAQCVAAAREFAAASKGRKEEWGSYKARGNHGSRGGGSASCSRFYSIQPRLSNRLRHKGYKHLLSWVNLSAISSGKAACQKFRFCAVLSAQYRIDGER